MTTSLRSSMIRKGQTLARREKASNCTGTRTPTNEDEGVARYWARLTERGDYELHGVPSTLGEHSRPGGVFPREGFE